MLKKFPALSWGTIAGVITAVLAVWESANATGSTNWTLLLVGVIPVIAGALTHNSVVPVETVRDAIVVARSATSAVNNLADKVDVAVQDRPTSGA
jgi:hypothetical protein